MKTKKIVHFSDTRGGINLLRKGDIPPCDIAIFSGNSTENGYFYQFTDFLTWFDKVRADYKIVIAGTKDTCLHRMFAPTTEAINKFRFANFGHNFYLDEEAITIDGLNIYGITYFRNQPKEIDHTYALYSDEVVLKKYDKIPKDTNVLITSVPPYGILDTSKEGEHLGNKLLGDYMDSNLPELKLHCFGKTYNHGIYDTFNMKYSNGNLLQSYLDMGNYPNVFELEYD